MRALYITVASIIMTAAMALQAYAYTITVKVDWSSLYGARAYASSSCGGSSVYLRQGEQATGRRSFRPSANGYVKNSQGHIYYVRGGWCYNTSYTVRYFGR